MTPTAAIPPAVQGKWGTRVMVAPPAGRAGSSGKMPSTHPKTSNPNPSQDRKVEVYGKGMVDVRGLEPLTSALRTRRSSS